ncbi:MAG TPA: ribosome biogenesis GTP-binding protein YihA/YsxC [Myxococcales bacterium]|jgi:GTP-binding protein
MSGNLFNAISAEFKTTAVEMKGWPKPDRPEIAFAGRSNVGKSSMINALCKRKKLVRVSNTPGRTRTLNFFDVTVEDKSGKRHEVRFCDLPGYGFAKASKADRADWGKMIESYVKGREGLRAMVCIVDAEVGPTPDDVDVIPWLIKAGRPVIVVATKVDRLPKHKRIPRLQEIEKKLEMGKGEAIGFSSTEGLNLDVLWARILGP